MDILKIEFFGDTGRVHNVRFKGDAHANLEVILGIFYEQTDLLLRDLKDIRTEAVDSRALIDYDFGDFISGSITKTYVTIKSDEMKSKSYKVRTIDLISVLKKWHKFKSQNRSGVVKEVTIEAEVF